MRTFTFLLTVVGGYFAWQNRFAIQRQLEAIGIKTPLLKGNASEAVQSLTSKARGKLEHGLDVADEHMQKRVG